MKPSSKDLQNSIEVELRSEISPEDYTHLRVELEKKYTKIREFKRLSVLFLNDQNNQDIRIRIDSSSKAEVAIKYGDYHSSERLEKTRSFPPGHFTDIVKSFALFGYPGKIIERETVEFDLGDGVLFSLVLAPPLAYTELEKMSSKEGVKENTEQLKEICNLFDLEPITKEEFYDLCRRLGEKCDLTFNHWRPAAAKELENRLTPYLPMTA